MASPSCRGTSEATPNDGEVLVRRQARITRNSRGIGLLDLVVTLAIFGLLMGISAPRLLGGPDRWITAQATEEVVATLYRARLEARQHGGAITEVRTGEGIVVRLSDGTELARWEPSDPRLRFEVAGSRDVAELAFGPAGTGRFANATLQVRRGHVTREVVVSSYGRIRR